DALYVDRNGNGDLTEPGKQVAMPPFEGGEDVGYAEQRQAEAGEVRDDPFTHTGLEITQLRLRHGFTPRNREETWLKEFAEAIPDGFAYMVSVKVERRSRHGERLGRVKEIAWADEHGLLNFADRPENAPVIHFDGPLRMGLLPGQALVRGARP